MRQVYYIFFIVYIYIDCFLTFKLEIRDNYSTFYVWYYFFRAYIYTCIVLKKFMWNIKISNIIFLVFLD